MHSPLLRILDANANRAREALRVLEDSARFILNDQPATALLKNLRHDLASALALLPMDIALLTRDTPHDVGTSVKTPAEFHRANWTDLLIANAKRLTEALRSLEESAKAINPAAALALEQLRYRAYTLEQSLLAAASTFLAADRFHSVRLYILLTDSLCDPSLGWEGTLHKILSAAPTDAPNPLCIQLREKSLPDAELLRRASLLTAACKATGALSIINDRPDIALLSHADGVHVGQTDLPLTYLRHLLGPLALLGISTENLTQLHQALPDNPTYLAVGPMFPTTTKFKPRIAGPAYAREALTATTKPLVAIGGITLENLPDLLATGIRTIATSSAILQSPNPAQAVQHFLHLLPP